MTKNMAGNDMLPSGILPANQRWTVSEYLNRLCPVHWEAVCLGHIFVVQNGFAFDSKMFAKDGGFPIIRIRDVRRGWTSDCYIGQYGSEYIVRSGDVLIGMDGEFSVGVWKSKDALLNQRVCRLIPYGIEFDRRFVLVGLQRYLRAVENVTSSLTVKHLSSRTVRELRLALPPIGEQIRIADKIDALFAHSAKAKAALDRIPALLDKLKRSILAAAFSGELTKDWRAAHPDVEPADQLLARIRAERRRRWEEAELEKMRAKGREPRDDKWKAKYKEPPQPSVDEKVPSGWVFTSLESITDSVRTIRYGILKPGPNVDCGIPYIKVKHMATGYIDIVDLPKTSREVYDKYAGAALRDGDVLISIRGSWGRTIEVGRELEGVNITQDSARIAPLPPVRQDFLRLQLMAPAAKRFMDHVAKGMAVKGVNISDLRRLPVVLCGSEEAELVGRKASAALGLLEGIRGRVSETQEWFEQVNQSILSKAFRGELVPQDPTDEPASVLLQRIQAERATAPKKPKKPKSRGAKGARQRPK